MQTLLGCRFSLGLVFYIFQATLGAVTMLQDIEAIAELPRARLQVTSFLICPPMFSFFAICATVLHLGFPKNMDKERLLENNICKGTCLCWYSNVPLIVTGLVLLTLPILICPLDSGTYHLVPTVCAPHTVLSTLHLLKDLVLSYPAPYRKMTEAQKSGHLAKDTCLQV